MSGNRPSELIAPAVLELPFKHREYSGFVHVTVEPNLDPARWGFSTLLPPEQFEMAVGFPICRATVNYSGEGYFSLFGWVQLVCSGPPGSSEWELDPLVLLSALDLPFAFFGLAPTLFDAPVRRDRTAVLHWTAHSFLCAVPGPVGEHIVTPVAAFRWGFQLRDGDISIEGPSALAVSAWNEHRPMLTRAYPSWTFRS